MPVSSTPVPIGNKRRESPSAIAQLPSGQHRRIRTSTVPQKFDDGDHEAVAAITETISALPPALIAKVEVVPCKRPPATSVPRQDEADVRMGNELAHIVEHKGVTYLADVNR
jgi:hypothetical protein